MNDSEILKHMPKMERKKLLPGLNMWNTCRSLELVSLVISLGLDDWKQIAELMGPEFDPQKCREQFEKLTQEFGSGDSSEIDQSPLIYDKLKRIRLAEISSQKNLVMRRFKETRTKLMQIKSNEHDYKASIRKEIEDQIEQKKLERLRLKLMEKVWMENAEQERQSTMKALEDNDDDDDTDDSDTVSGNFSDTISNHSESTEIDVEHTFSKLNLDTISNYSESTEIDVGEQTDSKPILDTCSNDSESTEIDVGYTDSELETCLMFSDDHYSNDCVDNINQLFKNIETEVSKKYQESDDSAQLCLLQSPEQQESSRTIIIETEQLEQSEQRLLLKDGQDDGQDDGHCHSSNLEQQDSSENNITIWHQKEAMETLRFLKYHPDSPLSFNKRETRSSLPEKDLRYSAIRRPTDLYSIAEKIETGQLDSDEKFRAELLLYFTNEQILITHPKKSQCMYKFAMETLERFDDAITSGK